jgi:predicted transcriptional regulator
MAARRYRRFGPRLTLSLSGGDYDRLQALADKGEVSISWVVRRAIEDYLHRHPQPSVRMPRLAARSLSALA